MGEKGGSRRKIVHGVQGFLICIRHIYLGHTTKDVCVLLDCGLSGHYDEVRTRLKSLFGQRLYQLRMSRNWSQEDLSARADISARHIGSIENGHREPCLETLFSLAVAFEMKASQLIEDLERPLN